jgi:hypothetical protein
VEILKQAVEETEQAANYFTEIYLCGVNDLDIACLLQNSATDNTAN